MPKNRAVWIGAAAIVVALLVVAVVASRGSGDDTTVAAGIAETRAVTVSGTTLAALPDSGTDPATGADAPVLTGKSFDGTPITIGRDGKAKLILFVAHWCPHCQREVPLLVSWLKGHDLPPGVELLTVATATSSDRPNYPPSAWLEDEGWKAPVLADSSDDAAATAFGLPGFPYLVGVDAQGKVVGRLSGEFTTDTFVTLAKATAA